MAMPAVKDRGDYLTICSRPNYTYYRRFAQLKFKAEQANACEKPNRTHNDNSLPGLLKEIIYLVAPIYIIEVQRLQRNLMLAAKRSKVLLDFQHETCS